MRRTQSAPALPTRRPTHHSVASTSVAVHHESEQGGLAAKIWRIAQLHHRSCVDPGTPAEQPSTYRDLGRLQSNPVSSIDHPPTDGRIDHGPKVHTHVEAQARRIA